jgi:hypothetical protein
MEKLETMHWFLAFAGAMIHSLLKVAELQREGKYKPLDYLKSNYITLIATVIMIPTLLIVVTDTSLAELLPINYVTALLAGYQTQSLFKSLISIGGKKYINDEPKDA